MVKDQEKNVPKIEEIMDIIRNIRNLEHKALCSFLYLTGCRISEVLKRFKPININLEKIDGKIVYILKVYTEKRRETHYRDIPISYDGFQKELIDNILHYIKATNLKDNEPLFNFSRFKSYLLVKEYFGFYQHFLRDTRLTHLIFNKGFNEHQLKKFTGWKDTRPSSKYVHADWRDLI